MSKKKAQHFPELPELLQSYAESRTLDYFRFSKYHMRIMDNVSVEIDFWTTAKYWVGKTDYVDLYNKPPVERGGEKGELPTLERKKLYQWLDDLFYPVKE